MKQDVCIDAMKKVVDEWKGRKVKKKVVIADEERVAVKESEEGREAGCIEAEMEGRE